MAPSARDPLSSLRFRTSSPCALLLLRTGEPIATAAMAATTIGQQGLGLMCRRLKPGEALFFPLPRPRRLSLHMLFVFTPIDVLFCRRKGAQFRIVEVKRALKPFTFYNAREEADLFIELPSGAAKGLKRGDILRSTGKLPKVI